VLGTQLVDQELARRQQKIRRLADEITAVNRELSVLAEEMALCRLALCLIELKARSERDDLDDWLRFAPGNGDGESALDSAIECLVKARLASIDAVPTDSGRFVYRLYPDWQAINAHLSGKPVALDLVSWLEEQTEGKVALP
jgi:hypothetical protein